MTHSRYPERTRRVADVDFGTWPEFNSSSALLGATWPGPSPGGRGGLHVRCPEENARAAHVKLGPWRNRVMLASARVAPGASPSDNIDNALAFLFSFNLFLRSLYFSLPFFSFLSLFSFLLFGFCFFPFLIINYSLYLTRSVFYKQFFLSLE